MINKLILGLLFMSTIVMSDDLLIRQGSVVVNLNDVDGFAYKIPSDVRPGFFDSPKRIENTVTNILTMKLINNYVDENNLIQENEIVDRVNNKISKLVIFDPTADNKLQQEIEYKLIKEYLYIEEKFTLFKEYFKGTVAKEGLIDLAHETYEVNKDIYYRKEARDLDYIAFKYTETNKNDVLLNAQSMLKDLLNGKIKYNDLLNQEINNPNVTVYKGLNNYQQNEKQNDFSDNVFSVDSIGLIAKLIDIESKFILVNVNRIKKAGNLKFEEVKGSILEKLTQDKIKREYELLIYNLTQIKVEINEENILSLRERYL